MLGIYFFLPRDRLLPLLPDDLLPELLLPLLLPTELDRDLLLEPTLRERLPLDRVRDELERRVLRMREDEREDLDEARPLTLAVRRCTETLRARLPADVLLPDTVLVELERLGSVKRVLRASLPLDEAASFASLARWAVVITEGLAPPLL